MNPELELVRLARLINVITSDLDNREEDQARYLAYEESLAHFNDRIGSVMNRNEELHLEAQSLGNRNQMLVSLLSESWDRLGNAEQQLIQVRNTIHADANLRVEIDRLAAENARYRQELDQLNTHVNALYASTSWRASAPIRAIKYSVVFCVSLAKRIVRFIALEAASKLFRRSSKPSSAPTGFKKQDEEYPQEVLRVFEDMKSELKL